MDEGVERFGFSEQDAQAFAIAKVIERKLGELSITINKEHFSELFERLRKYITENQKEIDLPKSIQKLAESSGHSGQVTLDLGGMSDEDVKESYIKSTQELVAYLQETESEGHYKTYATYKRRVANRHRRDQQFLRDHQNLWANTLDLLENYFLICFELGSAFTGEVGPRRKRNEFLLDALMRSHARACQIAFEVLTLLRGGFADGAHARWRTLHEISVICSFLSAHGDDLAERYFLYEDIRSYFDAKRHREVYKGNGEPPLNDDEFRYFELRKEELEKRFGKDYSTPNGWARSVLDDTRFASIERSMKMEHLRPYYNLANINIHAGSKALFFRLGQYPNNPKVLLAGPSNHGIVDPAAGAALSLGQVTTILLVSKPTVKRLASLNALQRLLHDLNHHFEARLGRETH